MPYPLFAVVRMLLLAAILFGGGMSARAQPVAVPPPVATPPAAVQTAAQSLIEDAADYARRHGVPVVEAIARLRAQEASVAETDRIAILYRDRLAGIAIEHAPVYRIVVLLTGTEPVPDMMVVAGGLAVPVAFRTGAVATRDQVAAAVATRRDAILGALPSVRGMGLDPRTGELVLIVRGRGALDPSGDAAADLTAVAGVPVRIRVLDRPSVDLALGGGARVEGVDPADGKRYACTTGFVVTDGARTGVVTAAHCPDTLTYRDPEGGTVSLDFDGQWGVAYQDVQLHVSDRFQRPLFYADSAKTVARTLTRWRNRASTRGGDTVCHRGETTGYSCSEVELIDYAPYGTLCAGPCDPVWVTVAGPSCAGGDSGGPVFAGTVAFGILKGGSYGRPGTCDFYYYMSTDYLPEGWTLLHAGSPPKIALDVAPIASSPVAAP